MTSTPAAEALAAEVLALAKRSALRIAVAESLTGGLLADALVSIPGASSAFSGGVVAYDTDLKRRLLGVDAAVLREHGPVAAAVARQMARGVRQSCAVARAGEGPAVWADLGVSTTGVAGPDPDPQTGQPAGTVWVGVSSAAGDQAIPVTLAGSRAEIRRQAVVAALSALRDVLQKI